MGIRRRLRYTSRRHASQLATCGLVVASTLALAGCGGGEGIEFNGKIFDWMGIGANSPTARDEPQLAQRGPLVPPPALERLPEPGSVRAPPPAAATNWPGVDPNSKQASLAEEERKKKEYCSSAGGDWKGKTFGSQNGNGAQSGEKPPYDCPNILTSIGDMFSSGKSNTDADTSLQGAKPLAARSTPAAPPAQR